MHAQCMKLRARACRIRAGHVASNARPRATVGIDHDAAFTLLAFDERVDIDACHHYISVAIICS
jgi:hypothetical protein